MSDVIGDPLITYSHEQIPASVEQLLASWLLIKLEETSSQSDFLLLSPISQQPSHAWPHFITAPDSSWIASISLISSCDTADNTRLTWKLTDLTPLNFP